MITIYVIRSRSSEAAYVGATSNRRSRESAHLTKLVAGTHESRRLQDAADAAGAGTFFLEVLEICQPGAVKERENFWMSEMAKTHRVVNVIASRRSTYGGHHQKKQKRAARTLTPEQSAFMNSLPKRKDTEKIRKWNARRGDAIAKPIRNLDTGEIYRDTAEACKAVGCSVGTLLRLLAAGYSGRPGWPVRVMRLAEFDKTVPPALKAASAPNKLSLAPSKPQKIKQTLSTERSAWMNSFPRGPTTDKQKAYYARVHEHRRKPIKNLSTGEIYPSADHAARAINGSKATVHKLCNAGFSGKPGWPVRLMRMADWERQNHRLTDPETITEFTAPVSVQEK